MAQQEDMRINTIDSSQDGNNTTAGGAQPAYENEEPDPCSVKKSIYSRVLAKPASDESNTATASFKGAGGDASIDNNDASGEGPGGPKNMGGTDAKADVPGDFKHIGGGDAKAEALGDRTYICGGDTKAETAAAEENEADEDTSQGTVDNDACSSVASREPAWLLHTKELIKEALIINSRIIEEALEIPGVKSFLSNLRSPKVQHECGIVDDLCKCFSSIDQFLDILEVAGSPLILEVALNDLSFLVYGNQRFPDPITGDDEDLAPCVDLLWKLADREFDKEDSEPLYFGDPALVARGSELLFYFERQVRVLKFLLEYNKIEPSERADIAEWGMDYEALIKNRVAVLEEFLYEALEMEAEKNESK